MSKKRSWIEVEGKIVEEERFEVEGSCELYVGIYVNLMVEATAR